MSKPVRAGRLRHRITIQEFVTDLDSDGARVEDWLHFAGPLSAEISAMSGKELLAAAAVQSKVTTRIKIRYLADLKPSMRAIHRGKVYNIESVIPDPDSGIRYITMTCSDGISEEGH